METVKKCRLTPKSKILKFMRTGVLEGFGKLTPEMEVAVFTVLTLMVEGVGWWAGLDEYNRGYYQGYIMFEVVVAVVGGVLTGGAATAAVLAKQGVKFGQVLKFIIPKLEKFFKATKGGANELRDKYLSKLRLMSENLDEVKALGWCFVAGTVIMTPQGAKPIEQIEVGDFVWSAHEETQELGFRPVMDLYTNVSPEIWTVSYDHDGDSATLDAEISCTPEHPFWSENERAFIPARDLKAGKSFVRLIDQKATMVTGVERQRGPPEGTPVYNFAVADHHTYFAGQGGVWVHNECSKLKEYIVAIQKSIKRHYKKQGFSDDVAYDKAQFDALAEFRKNGDISKWDDWARTQTGANLFENDPLIRQGAAADDVAVARRFIDETGLRVDGPSPQPVSIVRVGSDTRFASPKNRMPKEWGELAGKLQNDLNLTPGSPAWKAAEHSEALALMRMKEEVGFAVKELDMATAGQHVCGHCIRNISKGESGLAEIARKLGLEKVVVRSEKKFQTGDFAGESAVTILIDQAAGTSRVVAGVH